MKYFSYLLATALISTVAFAGARLAHFGGLEVWTDQSNTQYVCNLDFWPGWSVGTAQVCKVEGMCFAKVPGAVSYSTGNYRVMKAEMEDGSKRSLELVEFHGVCEKKFCEGDKSDSEKFASCLDAEAKDNGETWIRYSAPSAAK